MRQDQKVGLERLFKSDNYQTYTRSNTSKTTNSGGTNFTRILGSLRSGSEFPITEPSREVKSTERQLLSPVAAIDPLPKDQGRKLTLPTTPKVLDELSRNALEDRVREKKRKRQRCSFSGINGECCRPDIRCGERAQYSGRESDRQQTMPHRCLYNPYFSSDNIIIVENDPLQREFLLNSFKLFLNYDMDKIATLPSAEEATETLTRYKLQNRMIGLVVLNISSLGTGVYNLLTDLFDRNINAEIVLLSNNYKEDQAILAEFGTKMIAKDTPFISSTLTLPVHTEKFVSAVNTLHFGKFL